MSPYHRVGKQLPAFISWPDLDLGLWISLVNMKWRQCSCGVRD